MEVRCCERWRDGGIRRHRQSVVERSREHLRTFTPSVCEASITSHTFPIKKAGPDFLDIVLKTNHPNLPFQTFNLLNLKVQLDGRWTEETV